MKLLLVAILFVGLAVAEESFLVRHKRGAEDKTCSLSNIDNCCKNSINCEFDCSAKYTDSSYREFQKYTNDQLIRSFELLFLSAQFGTHNKDRPGFEKVFHGLADAAWNKGIEMIQESAKRGVKHSFNEPLNARGVKPHDELNEVQAMAKAFDIEKELLVSANDLHRIHSHASKASDPEKHKDYDAGLAHYLEEEIIEGKTGTVRKLVGHVNDLKTLFKEQGSSIFATSLYLFDQYLQK